MREPDIDAMARVLRGLWIAFLAATVVYVLVGFVLVRGRGSALTPGPDLRLVKPILWILGAVGLGFALLLRRRLLRRAFRDADTALIGVQSALVTGWAATDAVAILGLVLIFLGGSVLDGAPFFLAAFLVVAGQRPSADRLRERIREFRSGTHPSIDAS